jgi:antitoxin component HigA of HigAB toxin-antitoxin module
MLIEHYEMQQVEIASPDPIEAIKFRMEQLG